MFRRKSSNDVTKKESLRWSANTPERSRSAPSRPGRSSRGNTFKMHRMKGIMKFVTADDSLHSVYGSTSDPDASGRSRISGAGSDDAQRKSIEFKDILIREYSRTVGDNPSCSSGPPITIAWEYNPETTILSVEEYEECRPPRRTHFEMVLPREVRQQMLRKDWNVTQAQIASAVRNNIKIKNQRRSTVNNLGKADKVEEFFESAGRVMMRGLLLKKSTKAEVEKLESQVRDAQRAQRQQQLKTQEFEQLLYDLENDSHSHEFIQAEESEDQSKEEETDSNDGKDSKPLSKESENVANEQKATIVESRAPCKSDDGKSSSTENIPNHSSINEMISI